MKNKTILIMAGVLILLAGTLFVSGAFNLNKEDFTKKVKKISSEKLCEKEKEMKVVDKKCKENKTDVDVPDGFIFQNDEGVYMID